MLPSIPVPVLTAWYAMSVGKVLTQPKPVPVVPTTQYYALLRLLLPMPVLTWYWAFLPGVHQLVGLIGGADLGCYSWPVPCEWPQVLRAAVP